MNDELLRVEDLVVAYGATKILRGVSFTVGRGEILIIAGESGSGKSTILKAIGGLLGKGGAIVDGQIFFDDTQGDWRLARQGRDCRRENFFRRARHYQLD